MPWLPDNETLMQARTLKELAASPDFSGVSEPLPPLELGQLPVCPILQSIIHISCMQKFDKVLSKRIQWPETEIV